ncbi:MAG TPA: hypothetical protein VFU46_01340, partial [Gemmatimonadales bacterium]|nr:hypothetical protein [Gemmatimonadales bacterium]
RGTGLRAAVAATARFPTGFRERANRFIDVGTGTGHRAVDVALTTDVGAGRFGARVVGSYERSFAADYVARVTPPDQPFAPSSALRTVRAEPGDVVSFSARPFVRLAPPLALQAGVSWWRRGAATVTYATDADSIPGMPASVLARDTRASATILSAGVIYAAADAGRGGRGLPLEASWAWEQVVGASGGRVPKVRRVRAEVRIYVQLFD